MDSNDHSREIDVLIVGAGPAGATAALNLAPLRKVMLVDLHQEPALRIGESLPPAARRLFTDMGLWHSFQAQGHPPCYANRSLWGSTEIQETDFLRDPDGQGWHLDRSRFEQWMRRQALDRGAMLLAPAKLQSITRCGAKWQARVLSPTLSVEIQANVVIDAGGRSAPVARQLGARRRIEDRLVCAWLYGICTREMPGFTYIEAQEEGWWYTAPLPQGRRVLAFHTDADLPAAQFARDPKRLLQSAHSGHKLHQLLEECGFSSSRDYGFTAAHSAVLEPCAGPWWLAAGDAALSFDPLSSQGLLNALFTGLAAADAAGRILSGDAGAVQNYAQTIAGIHSAYRQHLRYYYRAEARWTSAPFWQRRQ